MVREEFSLVLVFLDMCQQKHHNPLLAVFVPSCARVAHVS